MKLLNIGCGYITHPEWINLDIAPTNPIVKSFDFRRGLPAPSESVDACYSSHVLEHARLEEANFLIQDCFRVLKSGGIIRIVVPDLEMIIREYLKNLEEVIQGDRTSEANYDWMVLELLDQVARDRQGGEMAKYLNQTQLSNEDFVSSRMGFELSNCRAANKKTIWEKLKSKRPSWFIQKVRYKISEILVYLVAGRSAQVALREGLFRNSGEIHRWMYDRYSLSRLLTQSGFTNIRVCQANESAIPNFNTYELDAYQGKIRKPDSLFIEATKP
jgi:predicted SAM-dependent methyltransferase